MSGSYHTDWNGLGEPREPMWLIPAYQWNGFLSFLWKYGEMLFHSFHSGVISFISFNPAKLDSISFPLKDPRNLIFLSFQSCLSFLWLSMDTSNLSFLSFHLCFTFLSGCRDLQFFQFFQFFCVFHFFQGVGTLISFNSFNSFVFFIQGAGTLISFISFVFFISFRVRGPSFLSFHLCFSFLSGCGDPHFFHFFCVLHFFQGAGTLISFISFVFFISFRVRGSSILSFYLCFSFLSGSSFLSFLYKISLGNISKKGNFQNRK